MEGSLLRYFYFVQKSWEEDKMKALIESNFFDNIPFDYNFNLQKFLMHLNKNDNFLIIFDKLNDFPIEGHYQNVIYNEKYEIFYKKKIIDVNMNNYHEIYLNDLDVSIGNNCHVQKMALMSDIMSLKIKILTNVLYYSDLELSNVFP